MANQNPAYLPNLIMGRAQPAPSGSVFGEGTPTILCLRTNRTDGTCYAKEAAGFRWQLEVGAVIEAPDWRPNALCGGGLHGLAWAMGKWSLTHPDESDAVWVVYRAAVAETVSIDSGEKVKSKRAEVVYVGDLDGALIAVGAASATGDSGAASATGYSGAASATGDSGAASATGDSGAASATGYSGAASATGDSGAASATGAQSCAMGMRAAAGLDGFIVCRWWDGAQGKYRFAGAAVDGEVIKPFVWYTFDGARFVELGPVADDLLPPSARRGNA